MHSTVIAHLAIDLRFSLCHPCHPQHLRAATEPGTATPHGRSAIRPGATSGVLHNSPSGCALRLAIFLILNCEFCVLVPKTLVVAVVVDVAVAVAVDVAVAVAVDVAGVVVLFVNWFWCVCALAYLGRMRAVSYASYCHCLFCCVCMLALMCVCVRVLFACACSPAGC